MTQPRAIEPASAPASRHVLLDCDPGIDDAVALALLLGSPNVDVVAVTTVAGNVPLSVTTTNALRLTEFFGAPGVPVVAGAEHPLQRESVFARYVHGVDGLGGAPLPPPARAAASGFGPDHIVEVLRERPGEVDLVAIGPMTNLALALQREPRITEWARRVVLMGGSYTRGNITPAAEFNFYADPEAADAVLTADWRPVLIGLDLTLRARVTERIMATWSGYGPLSERLLVPALGNYFDSRSLTADDDGLRDPTVTSTAPAIHDACAAAYVIDPSLFETVPALARVETAGTFTSGMSVVDFRTPHADTNTDVVTEIGLDPFWAMLSAAFETIATRVPDVAPSDDRG